MKTESVQWKLPVFIGSLLLVALLINTFFFTKAKHTRQAKEQQEQAAAAVVLADKAAKENAEKLRKEKEEADRVAAEKKLAKEKADAAAKVAKDKADADAKAAKELADADAKAAREQAARDMHAREEAARQKAIEAAAAEHARFLARYLNSGFTRKPGAGAIAVAIASEQGTANYEVAAAVARRFQTANVEMLTSFFKPEFVADKFVSDAFSGRTAIFEKLELTNVVDSVLFGRETVAYSTNPSLENTITANLRLELMALPVGTTRHSQSWEFTANGVGFKQHEARKLAEGRVIEQMAKATNMVLAPYPQPK